MMRINYIIAGICALMLFFFAAVILVYRDQHSFSTEKWVREPEKRWKMVDDLLVDYELVGMTESEILSLLGNSDESNPLDEKHRFVYDLGEGVSNIDSYWLLIDFSEGAVSQYCLTSD